MIINRKLNLVVSIDRGEGEAPLSVHAAPIILEAYKTYFMVLAKTFSTMMNERLTNVSGPATAALMLEQIAKTTMRAPGVSWWEDMGAVAGVENGLMAEIRRLSNVIAPLPDGAGWAATPLQIALDEGIIDVEEAMEVMNQLCFFTVVSWVPERRDRPSFINGAAYLFGGQTTSLNCTEYAASLKTSTEDATTGERRRR